MRNETAANRAIELYADTVRRVCFVHLKNRADVEDIFQEVFLKYMMNERPFESDGHEKAWIIRVAVNACKDTLKSFFRRNVISFDGVSSEPFCFNNEESETINAVRKLPENYRNAIYLHYYEGYSAVEIAGILGKSKNTVYTWLDRARKKLKEMLI